MTTTELGSAERAPCEGECSRYLRNVLVFLGESGWFSDGFFFFSVVERGKSINHCLRTSVTKVFLKEVTSLMFELTNILRCCVNLHFLMLCQVKF